jgi:DNA-binding response OmpR family regulator
MDTFNIFIVEDDPMYGELLKYHLGMNPDYKVTRFETAKACLEKLNDQVDLVTIDFSLPDMTGDALYRKIRNIYPGIPVIFISSQENITVAVDLLKWG